MRSVREMAPHYSETLRHAHRSYSGRINLARLTWLRPMLLSRWPLFLARSITFAGFVFTILAGWFGSPVGSHNFATIFVWIAWWSALKLIFIPLGGRSWCSVCPLPMPGEWLQQGGLITKGNRKVGLKLRWPRRLRGYWIPTALFLMIGVFSAVTLTDPRATAWIFLGLVVLAAGLSLIFGRRAFCTHVCPIGGFTGMYAQTAPIEVRVVNRTVCAAHAEKTCYNECPWGVYPLALQDSSQCGLCMECLRVCPADNIALNLRSFGSDLSAQNKKHSLDEPLLALVMLGSALVFTVVYSSAWGGLKTAALNIGSPSWLGYALGFLIINLVFLPAIFGIAVWLGRKIGRRNVSLRREAAYQSQVLLPLGLFAWIAFTISFALPKLSYVLRTVSDPMGLGWNLLGNIQIVTNADRFGWTPGLQIALLLVGLYWSVRLSRKLAEPSASGSAAQTWLAAAPMVVFSYLYTLLLMGLLVG